jgi:tetratricopeptide (TPR) repeat protein
MTMASSRFAFLTVAALSLATVSGAALAAGAGGGGGGEMPSVSAPSYDPAAEYQKGVDAYQKGDFKKAAAAFDRVLAAAPNNADVLMMLGMSKEGAGDLKGAERAYQSSVKKNPSNIDARERLAIALAKLNQADKAKAELDKLQQSATTCGGCADAAKLKSAVAAVQGALDQGAAKPTAMLTPPSLLFSTPAQGDSAYVQAVALINQHRYQEALGALDDAQKAFGPHPDVLTYMGYTYRKMGELDRAEHYYRQALAIAPSHRGATEYYGELKVERGDMTGARKMLAELDRQCAFGCAEAETLRRWIAVGRDPGA